MKKTCAVVPLSRDNISQETSVDEQIRDEGTTRRSHALPTNKFAGYLKGKNDSEETLPNNPTSTSNHHFTGLAHQRHETTTGFSLSSSAFESSSSRDNYISEDEWKQRDKAKGIWRRMEEKPSDGKENDRRRLKVETPSEREFRERFFHQHHTSMSASMFILSVFLRYLFCPFFSFLLG